MTDKLSEFQMERRRFLRFSIEIKLHYQCLKKASQSNLQTTTTKDIGAGGLAMYTSDKLDENQMLMLTLFLPGEVAISEGAQPGKRSKTFILAKVVWNKSITNSTYLQGIQFIDLKLEDRSRLRKFLVTYPEKSEN
ncbi:PilZ domain-containing protein [bacterium]|nr:PilZ domain-containing protein [bacterium]